MIAGGMKNPMLRIIKQLFKRKKPVEIVQDRSEWKQISRYFKHRYACVRVHEADTFLYLAFIEIDKLHRNKGIGSLMLRRIIWYANRYGKDVVLEATDAVGTELEKLFDYYVKRGFKQTKLERIPYHHNMVYQVRK